jgi:hypothetical protein
VRVRFRADTTRWRSRREVILHFPREEHEVQAAEERDVGAQYLQPALR